MKNLSIIGNLGGDATITDLKSGNGCVVSFSVAVDNGKDEQGNNKPADWFNVNYYFTSKEKAGVSKLLTKGIVVYVTGPLHINNFTNKSGEKKTGFEITVQTLRVLTFKESE